MRTSAHPISLTLLLCCVALACAGCQGGLFGRQSRASDNGSDPVALVLDRIGRAHPDLRGESRIAVWDFSPIDHRGRLAAVDAPPASQPASILNYERRAPSGAHLPAGLETSLSASTRLLLTLSAAADGRLPTDWTPYALLLLSIYAPDEPARVELTIVSGEGGVWQRAFDLGPGWNSLRIDLAEIGVELDLSRIADISIAAPHAATPVKLWIDDLALANNRRRVRDSGESADDLAVYEVGDRIHVRAAEKFDLAFGRGVLISWTADAAASLVPPTGLGPWPIALETGAASPAPSLGESDLSAGLCHLTATAHEQRVIEATDYRVVLETTTTLTVPGESPRTIDLVRRFVIYPDGAVYVHTHAVPSPFGGDGQTGFAIAVDARQRFELVRPASTSNAPRFALLHRSGAARADLLWTPHRRGDGEFFVDVLSADERRRVVVLKADAPPGRIDAAQLLRVWPPDLGSVTTASDYADDYQTPAQISTTVGRQRRDAPGDLDQDGFNESEGCYELRAEGGLMRFQFAPGATKRLRPRFRVADTRGRRCWVYADGRIIETQGRDVDGELLFTIPRTLTAPAAMEVRAR